MKLLLAALLFIATICLYSINLNYPLHFDDINTFDHCVTGTWNGLEARWLVNKTFEAQFSGGLLGLHMFNNSLHGICTVLLYGVFLRLSVKPVTAFLLACVWAFHPINIQAVTYICQRYACMSAMFCLLGFWLYLRARKTKELWVFMMAILSIGLACLSKQNAYIFPLIIGVYELIMAKNTRKGTLIIMLATISILVLVPQSNINIKDIFNNYGVRQFSPYERVLTETRVIVRYLWMLVYPLPGQFSISPWVELSRSVFSPKVIGSLILHIGIISASIFAFKKNRMITFGIIAFYLLMLPESSIANLELMFEHRMYLPMCFLLIGLAPMVNRIKIPIILFVIMLFMCNIKRQQVWSSEYALWEDSALKNPLDSRSQYNYACAMASAGDSKKAWAVLKRIPGLPDWRDNAPKKNAKLILDDCGDEHGNQKKRFYYFPTTLKLLQIAKENL